MSGHKTRREIMLVKNLPKAGACQIAGDNVPNIGQIAGIVML
jgi:hypothetical protein